MTGRIKSLTIRQAEAEDMTAVAEMAGEFHAYLAAFDDSDPSFDSAQAASKLRTCGFGARPLFSALIAEEGGQPVGYAIYSIGFWADAWQGMLIGRELMRQLAAAGKRDGCEMVMWTVWDKNEPAKRFYDRLGGVALDDEQLMSWRI
jgi:ribosomal protein S18 acetylase RimI-like enzyme